MSKNAAFPKWKFVEHHPEAKSRNPLQSELLNQESFQPADALVRESIQNSLDAKRPDSDKVTVRIYVSGDFGALSSDDVGTYFQDFWTHIEQCENGGQVASSLVSGPCRFVVIEDFGTVGLTGDVGVARVPDGVPNNYYYFLRAEGMSQKGSSNLGRWGVGKYVFPKSSGVNAFFAYTKRFDDSGPALLVGQSVLMNHSLDGKDFDPDGWWAKPGNGIQMPFTDPGFIQEVSTTWNVSRIDETGLSIVIPYVDEYLTGRDFVKAVIRAYFGAILTGHLDVNVEDPSDSSVINLTNSNVLELAEEYFEGEERERIVSDIQLVATKDSIPEDCRFTTNLVAARPDRGWSSSTIDGEMAAQIKQKLESGRAIRVTVPVELRLKPSSTGTEDVSIESAFDVLLQENEALRQKPLYMRAGIIIPEASRSAISGIRAICTVEEAALVKMLGDAENPAHTTWTANDRIRARYVRGGDVLTIVKTAPHEIYRLVLDAAMEEQRVIFADIFSVPLAEEENPRTVPLPSGRKKPGGKPTPGGEGSPSGIVALTRIEREDGGGFSVLPNERGRTADLKRVDVSVGYETRRGDALAKWRKEDFDLANLNLTILGGKVEKQSGNFLTASVNDVATFRLTILGFDVNRDLHIRARGHSK
ncbi:hypothetical protein AB0N24_07210 [Arthrobacter sp. NPDC093128]|uniref:hypothetical protein n=1 Tax=Arthrobacter sp. NPDC093128 TaxID=3154979 RepID=UPI00342271D9